MASLLQHVYLSFTLKCQIFFQILVHLDIQGTPLPPGWTSMNFLLTSPPLPPLTLFLVHVVVECPHMAYLKKMSNFYSCKGFLWHCQKISIKTENFSDSSKFVLSVIQVFEECNFVKSDPIQGYRKGKISVGNIIRHLFKKVQVFYILALNFTNLVILSTQCTVK